MAKQNPDEKEIKYWQDRNERQFLAGEKKGLDLAKELQKNYKDVLLDIENQIYSFYGKYAKEGKVSLDEAHKILSRDELKSFKHNLDKIIKYAKEHNLSKDYINKMKLLNMKLRVSRLEELKVQINYELAKLSVENKAELEKYLSQTYIDEYYETIFNVDQNLGFATNFAKLNKDMVQKAVAKNYDIGNYSVGPNKVWQNTDYLMKILEQKIPQGLSLRV